MENLRIEVTNWQDAGDQVIILVDVNMDANAPDI